MRDLEEAFARLNDEQRQAVEALDGPVLVVAGPGTGKTQLLSLRVANILAKRDVQARNVLCLTFTNAGAEAMTKRLAGLIGRDAYGVTVSTFHSFASQVRNRYPECFSRRAGDTQVTDLQADLLLNELLGGLSVKDPLYQEFREGVPGNLKDVQGFMSDLRRSGLRSEEFRAIVEQNQAFFSYMERQDALMERMGVSLALGKAQKRELLDALQEQVAAASAQAPAGLWQDDLDKGTGAYRPYVALFSEAFATTRLYDGETGRTQGFADLRDRFFRRDGAKRLVFRDRKVAERQLSALALYDGYRARLKERAQYDYDDMVLDAIDAIEGHPELKYALQERYRYVLVDEFQDTNSSQMRILNLLTDYDTRPNVLAVGDDDQAIMRFQGASVAYLNHFEEHYDDVARIVLKTNYRSTPPLVALGQQVARQIETRSAASATEKRLVAFREDGGAGEECAPSAASRPFTARRYPNRDLQYLMVARSIRQRIDEGFLRTAARPQEAIAVIAASHRSLRDLLPYLNHFDIAFQYRVTSAVSEIPSLQTLFALMRFAAAWAERKAELAESFLPQIVADPVFGIAPTACFTFALETKRHRMTWMDALASCPDKDMRALHAWLVELAAHALARPVREVLHEMAARVGRPLVAAGKEDPFPLIEFNYGLRALLGFVEENLGTAGVLGPNARLSDAVALMDQADRFDLKVEADIPIGRKDAITLTTAHGSKGLEYDLVYLIDLDNATWHYKGRSAGLRSANLLFGNEKDDDDARRLLFVALTRARTLLELSFGRGEVVRELAEEVEVRDVEPDVQDIVLQAQQGWEQRYYPSGPDLLALITPYLKDLKMAASRLNRFVEYRAGDPEGAASAPADEGAAGLDFILDSLLGLPTAPSYSLEFGSLVHSFMEDYLDHVVKAGDLDLAQLVRGCRERIDWMDFDAIDRERMRQRLDRVAEVFVPALGARLKARFLAEQWVSAELDGVPLVGKCDLLEFDDEARAVWVYDFKTGRPDALDEAGRPKEPSGAYRRQLQFYKLLIEHSAEYAGWTVRGVADLYVEPHRDLDGRLVEPLFVEASDEELEHLRLLIRAVWHRIQNGLFDTSAFEGSPQLAQLKAASVYASSAKGEGGHRKGDPKPPEHRKLQSAFEQWLIDDYLGRLE
ncbi:MAG: ATP-dependent helicase [Coriobacteriales bacterium]|jgi:DNA helicase-2/ATP-dependent DNA helicase PcrA|nr:ATP-dependent helicase [Coriobacteriales bacterium]